MTDKEKLIQDLQSDDLETRYTACKQLESEQTLSENAVEALQVASHDPEPLIARAAVQALNTHKIPLMAEFTPDYPSDAEQAIKDKTPSFIIWIIAAIIAIFLSFGVFVWSVNALIGLFVDRLDISLAYGICAVVAIILAIFLWIFVVKNMKGQLVKYDFISGDGRNSAHKKRHGCLSAWLIFGIISSIWTLISYGLNDYSIPLGQSMLINVVPFYIGLYGFSLLCYIALLRWKKWGFWGLCAVYLAASIISLATGGNIFLVVIVPLISIAITYGILQIGNENKGWPQLE